MNCPLVPEQSRRPIQWFYSEDGCGFFGPANHFKAKGWTFLYVNNYSDVRDQVRGPNRLRNFARDCVLSVRSLVLRPSTAPALRVLYCHYVFDDQRKQFESIIRYVQSIGEFVGTDQVLDILHGRVPLERNSFHLSFDDGMRNVVTNALPILRAHGVPAILFVPTAIISSSSGQFEEVRRTLATTRLDVEFATWTDLEKARAAGFEIGSHTRTHARLSGILKSKNAIEDEIFGSKADLERHLGGECRYMSWPYGRLEDASNDSLDVVRKAGYEACFGAFRGRVVPAVTNACRIPRHHFEPEWPLAHVKCFAHGAWEPS
jgi:peptidoglycan/xylan/chitin deacetylase (PgdA/CDA1 family)